MPWWLDIGFALGSITFLLPNIYTSRKVEDLNNSFIFPDAMYKNVETSFNSSTSIYMASRKMKLLFNCLTFLDDMHEDIAKMEFDRGVILHNVGRKEAIK